MVTIIIRTKSKDLRHKSNTGTHGRIYLIKRAGVAERNTSLMRLVARPSNGHIVCKPGKLLPALAGLAATSAPSAAISAGPAATT